MVFFQLLLAIVKTERRIVCSSMYSKIPSVTSVVRQSSDSNAKKLLKTVRLNSSPEPIKLEVKAEEGLPSPDSESEPQVKVKLEPIDPDDPMDSAFYDGKDDKGESDQEEKIKQPRYYFLASNMDEIISKRDGTGELAPISDDKPLKTILSDRHSAFLNEIRQYKTGPFLTSMAQLCHRSTLLAHKIWIDLFPKLWTLLQDKHHQVLSGELGPFLCSGSHLHQTDCYRSSINTLVESMAKCSPPIPIRPVVLKYLGKTHNLWHRSAILLEEAGVACEDMVAINPQLPLQQPWLDYGKL